MPNYSLVVDSKFKPFSLQDMLVPVMMEANEHKEIQKNLADLEEQADVWKGMINPENDPQANAMYQRYADDLTAQAERLQRYGLDYTSRQNMYKMRSRYRSEIQPIETAFNRRRTLEEEQRKALLQNPTMLYERMAKDISLDDFINNPELDYGRSYSGALLTQQVATAAANIAKEARDSEQGKSVLRKLLPFQYELIRQNGFSRESVMQAILDSPDADRILTDLVEGAMTTSGIRNWEGDQQENIARGLDYARQGLWSAIGQTNYGQVTDQYNMQEALRRSAARQAQVKEKQRNLLEINPINLYTPEEIQNMEDASKYSKYFDKKTGKLNKAGWDEYKKLYTVTGDRGPSASGSPDYGKQRKHSEFHDFMNRIGAVEQGYATSSLANEDASKIIQPGNMYNLWKNYMNMYENRNTWDARKDTAYRYQYDSTMQDNMKDALLTSLGTTGLQEAKYTKEGWKATGKTLSPAELASDDYTIIAQEDSSRGNVMVIKQKDGKTKRYIAPVGMHPVAEHNRDAALQALDVINRDLMQGYITDELGVPHWLSPYEREILKQQQEDLISQGVYGNQSRIAQSYTTPAIKFNNTGE